MPYKAVGAESADECEVPLSATRNGFISQALYILVQSRLPSRDGEDSVRQKRERFGPEIGRAWVANIVRGMLTTAQRYGNTHVSISLILVLRLETGY